MRQLSKAKIYGNLINDISFVLEQGRKNAYQAVNCILVKTYWEVGKRIVDFEKKNDLNTGYGSKFFEKIAELVKKLYFHEKRVYDIIKSVYRLLIISSEGPCARAHI